MRAHVPILLGLLALIAAVYHPVRDQAFDDDDDVGTQVETAPGS